MAKWVMPNSVSGTRLACKLNASGVVRLGKPIKLPCILRVALARKPKVPIEADCHVARPQIWRRNSLVEVLPLVPVIAAIMPGCLRQKRAAAVASANRALCV